MERCTVNEVKLSYFNTFLHVVGSNCSDYYYQGSVQTTATIGSLAWCTYAYTRNTYTYKINIKCDAMQQAD